MPDHSTDFLSHYGIKGMKWGRRSAESRAREARSPKPSSSEDHETVSALRKNPTRSLSNNDLKKINERLQLEKTYKELSANKSALDKGQKKVDRILKTANTAQQVYNLYNSPMVKNGLKIFEGK